MPPSQGLEDLGSESSIPPCLGVVSAAGWGPWGCPQPALQLEPEPLGFLFSGHWLWNTQVPVQFCGPPLCDLYSCVCVGGGGSIHTGGSDQDPRWPTFPGAGLLHVKVKSRKGLWRVCGWRASPPPSQQLSSESGGVGGVARQHPCPAPLTCASAVSSSLDLLLCLHPVPLPLRAHWILNDGSVSPTPTLGHSRASPRPPGEDTGWALKQRQPSEPSNAPFTSSWRGPLLCLLKGF